LALTSYRCRVWYLQSRQRLCAHKFWIGWDQTLLILQIIDAEFNICKVDKRLSPQKYWQGWKCLPGSNTLKLTAGTLMRKKTSSLILQHPKSMLWKHFFHFFCSCHIS
jgi:hypothetical protein